MKDNIINNIYNSAENIVSLQLDKKMTFARKIIRLEILDMLYNF